jgi:hypothetical protein
LKLGGSLCRCNRGSSGSPRAPCSDSWHNASPEVRRCVDEAERGVQQRSAMPRYPTAPSARQAQRTPRPGARGAGGADAVTGQGREAGDQLDERRGEGGVSVAGAARNWATAAPASRGRRRFSRHVSPDCPGARADAAIDRTPPHAQGAHTRVLPRRHPTRTTQPPGNEEGGEHPNPAA